MNSRTSALPVRARLALAVALASALGLLVGVAGGAAHPTPALAGTSAVANRGSTGVTADALPTVQVNGVVWTQLVVGNTVYVGGKFSTARPSGAAPGKSTVRRANLLAFDIRNGKLIASFAPTTNGAVRALAVSPDKKTLYVGGEFTTVNGAKRLQVRCCRERERCPASHRLVIQQAGARDIDERFDGLCRWLLRQGRQQGQASPRSHRQQEREAAVLEARRQRVRLRHDVHAGSSVAGRRWQLLQDRSGKGLRDVAAGPRQG